MGYLISYTGKRIDIPDPKPEQIDIVDIATQLSRLPRFVGATSRFFCPTLDEPVLTSDFRWVPIGDLSPGDGVLGFDESPTGPPSVGGTGRRKWRNATVTHMVPRRARVLKLHFSDGSSVRCSEDHPWLVIKSPGSPGTGGGKNSKWRKASDMLRLHLSGHPQRMRRYFDPWKTVDGYDAGWLAGMFDGEGTVATARRGGIQLAIAQNRGPVLDRLRAVMGAGGFDWRENTSKPCVQMQLRGGAKEAARLVGSYRPVRMLNNLSMDGRHFMSMDESLVVEAIEECGEDWVAGIETSTHTYICNGFAAHNSVAQHSIIVSYLSVAVAEHYSPPPHLDGFLRQQMLKEGLLHDGHESYMGDTPSPLKIMLGKQFHNVERSIDRAVRQKFQLASTMPPNVKVADYMALMIESAHLRGPDTLDLDRIPSEPKGLITLLANNGWYRLAERTVAQHWDHETAKDKFLKEWYYIEG